MHEFHVLQRAVGFLNQTEIADFIHVGGASGFSEARDMAGDFFYPCGILRDGVELILPEV